MVTAGIACFHTMKKSLHLIGMPLLLPEVSIKRKRCRFLRVSVRSPIPRPEEPTWTRITVFYKSWCRCVNSGHPLLWTPQGCNNSWRELPPFGCHGNPPGLHLEQFQFLGTNCYLAWHVARVWQLHKQAFSGFSLPHVSAAPIRPGCSGMWDKITCWPSADVGDVVAIPCPKFLFYFSEDVPSRKFVQWSVHVRDKARIELVQQSFSIADKVPSTSVVERHGDACGMRLLRTNKSAASKCFYHRGDLEIIYIWVTS